MTENSADRKPLHPPWRGAELFLKGAITVNELALYVFARLTEQNIAQFLAVCPDEVLDLLRQQSGQFPANGEEWHGYRVFAMASYVPGQSNQEIEDSDFENHQRFRAGLKLFRSSVQL